MIPQEPAVAPVIETGRNPCVRPQTVIRTQKLPEESKTSQALENALLPLQDPGLAGLTQN